MLERFTRLVNQCKAAWGHSNPFGKDHGAPDDLGNILTPNARKTIIKVLDRYALLDGEFSIKGKAIVIHEVDF